MPFYLSSIICLSFLSHSTTCKSPYHCYDPAPGVRVCDLTHFYDSFFITAKYNFCYRAQSIAGVYKCVQARAHTHTHIQKHYTYTQTRSGTNRLPPQLTVWSPTSQGEASERIKFPDTSLNAISMRTSYMMCFNLSSVRWALSYLFISVFYKGVVWIDIDFIQPI